MKKTDKKFVMDTLKNIGCSICLSRQLTTVWLTSKKYGVSIEKIKYHKDGTETTEKYSIDGVEWTIDYIMNEFKSYKVDHKYCVVI